MTKNTNNKPARLYVISAPSGAGKTTLVRALLLRNPRVQFSISYTTRKARVREKNGDDYFFVNKEEFERMVKNADFLEHAQVFDNYYGTAKSQVQNQLDNDQHVLLEIDWQGAQQIRRAWPGCVSVFILPPSLQELERRLRTRGTDSEEVIQRRLQDSISDISHWSEFDHSIINDNLSEALVELENVINAKGDDSLSTNQTRRKLIQSSGYSLPIESRSDESEE